MHSVPMFVWKNIGFVLACFKILLNAVMKSAGFLDLIDWLSGKYVNDSQKKPPTIVFFLNLLYVSQILLSNVVQAFAGKFFYVETSTLFSDVACMRVLHFEPTFHSFQSDILSLTSNSNIKIQS